MKIEKLLEKLMKKQENNRILEKNILDHTQKWGLYLFLICLGSKILLINIKKQRNIGENREILVKNRENTGKNRENTLFLGKNGTKQLIFSDLWLILRKKE